MSDAVDGICSTDLPKRIYIVGGVACGKTTLANELSAASGIPCYHLDQVVHRPDKSAEGGSVRRTDEEIASIFGELVKRQRWIFDDIGRDYFAEGLRRADALVYLEVPAPERYRRVIVRFIRQRLGLEQAGYTPTWHMLRMMLIWTHRQEREMAGYKEKMSLTNANFIVLRNGRERKAFIERFRD